MSALRKLWALRRERPGLVLVAGATLLALAAYPFVDWWLRSAEIAATYEYWDWGAFGGARERWQAGEPIYRRTEGGFHGSFLYPPVAIALYLPFDGLGQDPAARVWNVVTVGMLWVGLQLVVRELGYDLGLAERGGLLWLLVGFQPLILSMKLGQMAPFMAALLSVSLAALLAEDWPRAGLLAGAATGVVGVVKLAYAPVGAHLLADRRRFAGAVGAAVVLAGLSVLVFGLAANRTYLEVLAWGVSRGGQSRPPTLWLAPYYRPLHWLPGAQWLRVGGSLAVAAFALGSRGRDDLVFAMGVTAFPLFTPLAYTYYFVALLPAVLVLLREELVRDGLAWVPVAGLLFLHLHAYGLRVAVGPLPDALPPLAVLEPYWVLQPGLWGNALLFGLALVRVAEHVPLAAAIEDRGWT